MSGGVRARGAQVPDSSAGTSTATTAPGEVWALEVLGEGAAMAPGRQVDLGELPRSPPSSTDPTAPVYALSQRGSIVRLDPA